MLLLFNLHLFKIKTKSYVSLPLLGRRVDGNADQSRHEDFRFVFAEFPPIIFRFRPRLFAGAVDYVLLQFKIQLVAPLLQHLLRMQVE